MQASVLLFYRDRATGEWRRSGTWQPFEDDARLSGKEKATRFGEAWVRQATAHRAYKIRFERSRWETTFVHGENGDARRDGNGAPWRPSPGMNGRPPSPAGRSF